MKRVSVIIPCYRDSATLERAIKSVLAQSYPAIEIVVVNDCSPESDEIERVIGIYPQVAYLRNDSNLGLAGSRNAGIAIASGDYIALLDADDEYHPEKISVQMDVVEPGVAVTCGVAHVLQNGSPAKRYLANDGQRIFSKPEHIIFRNTLNGAGLFIERDLLLMHGCFDDSLRSCEDFDLWLRLLARGVKIKDIGKCLYFYYVNPEGLSMNLVSISKWEVEALLRHARRKGDFWFRSPAGVAVGWVWILRQLIRCELRPNVGLIRQVSNNIDLVISFPFLRGVLHLIRKLHIMFIPAQIVRLLGLFRTS